MLFKVTTLFAEEESQNGQRIAKKDVNTALQTYICVLRKPIENLKIENSRHKVY